MWLEYESLLRDTQTNRLQDVKDWLAGNNSAVAIASIHRDRAAVLAAERAITLRAKMAKAVINAASETGESDVLKGGRILAGQLIFNALSGLSAESLDGITPAQVLKLINTLGSLSKADVESDLIRARLDEINKATKAEIEKAAAATADKKLTSEAVYEVIDRIMRGEKAA